MSFDPCTLIFSKDKQAQIACDKYIRELGDDLKSGKIKRQIDSILDAPKQIKIANYIMISLSIVIIILLLFMIIRNSKFFI